MMRHWPRALVAAFLFLTLLNFYQVVQYSVDVPFWDEWEMMADNQLPAGFTWKWLFAQHNEHRIVLTKLQAYGLFLLNGWDLRDHQIMNFVMFALAVTGFCLFLRRTTPGSKLAVWLGFASLLMCPRLVNNRLWGFQSQFLFAWAFALLGVALLFSPQLRPKMALAGSLALVCSVFSFAGGVVMSLVIVTVFAIFVAGRYFQSRDKQGSLKVIACALVPIGLALTVWLVTFESPPKHPQLTMPWQPKFIAFFVNLLDSGFGIDQQGVIRGLFFSAVILVPLVAMLWRDRGRFQPETWALLAFAAALIGFLGSISMSRAGLALGESKSSRYGEISGLLIPIAAAAYWMWLKDRPRLQRRALLALALLTIGSVYDNWSFERYYQPDAQRRLAGIACLERFYFQGGSAGCPEIYPWPMANRYRNARTLNLSFYRRLEAKQNVTAPAQP